MGNKLVAQTKLRLFKDDIEKSFSKSVLKEQQNAVAFIIFVIKRKRFLTKRFDTLMSKNINTDDKTIKCRQF